MHTEKYQSKKRHGCGEQSRGTEHSHHDNPSLGAEQQFDDDGGGDCFEPHLSLCDEGNKLVVFNQTAALFR
ncbi:putative voltage-dependent N-type calcium channel subunit alpha-1B [Trichinella spiralis]|uniref:Voltage-dependent N-type calcium channel subunit alpha-1B n=1 Tax=Trichinella spiralis TaxID=6334 RepID=A0ABR3KMT2_TRISP